MDCSVDISKPPVIGEVTYGSVCNTADRDCSMVYLYGMNILSDKDLTCHITEVQVTYLYCFINTRYVVSFELKNMLIDSEDV